MDTTDVFLAFRTKDFDDPGEIGRDIYGCFSALSEEWLDQENQPKPVWYPYEGELLISASGEVSGRLHLGVPSGQEVAIAMLLQAVTSTIAPFTQVKPDSWSMEIDLGKSGGSRRQLRELSRSDIRGRQFFDECRNLDSIDCLVDLRTSDEIPRDAWDWLVYFFGAGGLDITEVESDDDCSKIVGKVVSPWYPTIAGRLIRLAMRALQASGVDQVAQISLSRCV